MGVGADKALRRKRRGRAGVTLIEFLVTTVVLLGVLALIALPLAIGFSFLERLLARTDAQRAARRATEAITRELAEAMYVFDIPPQGSQIAFVVPQSSATTPLPGAVVRYWLALRDPALTHKPYYQPLVEGRFVEPPYNPHFLARSTVDDPWRRDDIWNDTDAIWGRTRAAYFYHDGYQYPGGSTWPDSQPGYPWLEAVRLYPGGGEDRTTYYRENAAAVTPSDPNYDVAVLEFAAVRMSDETLAPGADCARHAARYPSWSDFAAPEWDTGTSAWVWNEVGGVRIYRGDVLICQTKVKSDDGSVWVCAPGQDPGDSGTYNTRWYPLAQVGGGMGYRSPVDYPYAFGIDYDSGAINFAFPAVDSIPVTLSASYALPTVASAADGVVVAGSDRVSIDGELYRRVDGMPSEGEREYHIEGSTLQFGAFSPPTAGTITAHYEYRNNQDSDMALTTYDTKKLITISITVSKQDRTARGTRDARQDFRQVSRVEVRNTPD